MGRIKRVTDEQVYIHEYLTDKTKYLTCVAILLTYNDSMSQLVWKAEATFLALRNPDPGGTLLAELVPGWAKVGSHLNQS